MSWNAYQEHSLKSRLIDRLPVIAAGAAVVVVVVLIAIFALAPTNTNTNATNTTVPSKTEPVATDKNVDPFATTVPPPDGHDHEAVLLPEEKTQIKDTATRFVQAWGKTGITQQQWLAGIRPYVTQDYFAMFATVNPDNFDPATVNGQATILFDNAFAPAVRVPTTIGNIDVELSVDGKGYLVHYLEPADPEI